MRHARSFPRLVPRAFMFMFAIALAFVILFIAPSIAAQHHAAQQKKSFGARIFFQTAGSRGNYATYLFSVDGGIKEYPPYLSGSGNSATLGIDLGKSWDVFARGYRDHYFGTGPWVDTDGLSPEEAAYVPIAFGGTGLTVWGAAGGVDKQLFCIRVVCPFTSASGGMGILKLRFDGTASAIDPTDGQPFTVPAGDRVRRWMPVAALEGGLAIRTPFGVTFRPDGGWRDGWQVSLGVRYHPFARFSKNR